MSQEERLKSLELDFRMITIALLTQFGLHVIHSKQRTRAALHFEIFYLLIYLIKRIGKQTTEGLFVCDSFFIC